MGACRPAASELDRQILYAAVSKKLTGFTGVEHKPGESFEHYRSDEFQQACEILNAEIDTVKNQQATCLRAERRPVSVMDRDYTLVMVMQAFADYLRFKPTE